MTTTTKKTNWKPTDHRFVCFIDLLGFKDKVMRKSHEEIYSELNKISSTKKALEDAVNDERLDKWYDDVDIYIVSFSDSIVIFTKSDSLDNFRFFILAIRLLMANAVESKIAMKGGIAHGLISVNKSEQIYFGQPIIDAYLIEEDVNFFGIVCHNSVDSIIRKNINIEIINRCFKFIETPLKCGYLNHYILDWYYPLVRDLQDLSDDDKMAYIISIHKEFYDTVSGSPRKYIDNSIKLLRKMYDEGLVNLDPINLK